MGELNIELIPLNSNCELPQKQFPRMPMLYLELFENKTKVRRELLNRLYVPPPMKENVVIDNSTQQEIQNVQSDPQKQNVQGNIQGNSQNQSDPQNQSIQQSNIQNNESEAKDNPATEQNNESEDLINDQLTVLLGEEQENVTIIKQPPSLQELQQKKKVTIQNSYYADEDDEELQKERNSVYFKYEVLRRMHPNAHIPEFTLYSDPKLMAQKYEMLTKKLSLESSVENWKRYMIVFVMGCEVVLGKVNFDIEGFAQQQIMSMSTYDQLLVEMAEKSYVPTGSKWSPELRLLMMLTMNVTLFIVSKMIFKKTGTNLLGTINNMTNVTERTMKEPSTTSEI